MNKYLNVMECIGTPSAITQESGDIVYGEICSAIDANEIIELDFKDVESIISPFLNNSIGKLYGKYNGETVGKYVKFLNLPAEKIPTINMVISNAKKYYLDKEEFKKVVEGVVG